MKHIVGLLLSLGVVASAGPALGEEAAASEPAAQSQDGSAEAPLDCEVMRTRFGTVMRESVELILQYTPEEEHEAKRAWMENRFVETCKSIRPDQEVLRCMVAAETYQGIMACGKHLEEEMRERYRAEQERKASEAAEADSEQKRDGGKG